VLTVSTGSLAVYCGDSAAVRAFAAAWAAATTYAVQARLPKAVDPAVSAGTEHAGVLLRVSGAPAGQVHPAHVEVGGGGVLRRVGG
jgi:hypothetical protein